MLIGIYYDNQRSSSKNISYIHFCFGEISLKPKIRRFGATRDMAESFLEYKL